MELSPYVRNMQDQLIRSAEAVGLSAESVEVLIGQLDSVARLALLQTLSDAAAEISLELPDHTIDVALRNGDPVFLIASFPTVGSSELTAQEDAVDGSQTSRTTLRLPEAVKDRVEAAAEVDGVSVNTWLVRAITATLARNETVGAAPITGRRLTGWAH